MWDGCNLDIPLKMFRRNIVFVILGVLVLIIHFKLYDLYNSKRIITFVSIQNK